MDPFLAMFSSPLYEWRHIHPLRNHAFITALVCKKGNSALRELFLILGGSARVTAGAAGQQEDGRCGGPQAEKERL